MPTKRESKVEKIVFVAIGVILGVCGDLVHDVFQKAEKKENRSYEYVQLMHTKDYEIAISDITNELGKVTRQVTDAHNGAARDIMRRAIVAALARSIRQNEFDGSVDAITVLFSQIITCIERNDCDKDTIVEHLGDKMFTFAQLSCGYWEEKGKLWKDTVGEDIALFLLEVGYREKINADSERENLFLCDGFRMIENDMLKNGLL